MATNAVVKMEPPVSLIAWAQGVWASSAGVDLDAVCAVMRREVTRTRREELLDWAVRELAMLAVRVQRASYMDHSMLDEVAEVVAERPKGVATLEPVNQAQARITAAGINWLRYPMRRGKPLGECTGAEVSEQRDFHGALEQTNGLKRRFFDLIAQRVPEAEKVHSRLSHNEIAALWCDAAKVQ